MGSERTCDPFEWNLPGIENALGFKLDSPSTLRPTETRDYGTTQRDYGTYVTVLRPSVSQATPPARAPRGADTGDWDTGEGTTAAERRNDGTVSGTEPPRGLRRGDRRGERRRKCRSTGVRTEHPDRDRTMDIIDIEPRGANTGRTSGLSSDSLPVRGSGRRNTRASGGGGGGSGGFGLGWAKGRRWELSMRSELVRFAINSLTW